jgi:hypothetical protein
MSIPNFVKIIQQVELEGMPVMFFSLILPFPQGWKVQKDKRTS